MILFNAKIYSEGLIRKGAILIEDGKIKTISYFPTEKQLDELKKNNADAKILDCENKLIIPGIIDIHSHLRDLGQSDKETFLTGTKAAAYSGITTVFNMPNTKPPSISSETVQRWMNKAMDNIYVNVGFISGVPEGMDYQEIMKIIDLGVIGFKIYPLNSLNGINWNDPLKVQKLLHISSKFQIPIFIHPDRALPEAERELIIDEFEQDPYSVLKLHDKLYPPHQETEFINFVIENYQKLINDNNIKTEQYPIIHFCHVSCSDSYSLISKTKEKNPNWNITNEITPHHLLLNNDVILENETFGKVLPPLRHENHSKFLFKELMEGRVDLIGTDHAPHTITEKSGDYFEAASGFPGFETYPLLFLTKVCHYELSLENFVKAASENPAKIFNLQGKGFIKENFDADLIIIDRIPEYEIKAQNFKSKAKFSPFENFKSCIEIWKVFIAGRQVNTEEVKPQGKIIKKSL